MEGAELKLDITKSNTQNKTSAKNRKKKYHLFRFFTLIAALLIHVTISNFPHLHPTPIRPPRMHLQLYLVCLASNGDGKICPEELRQCVSLIGSEMMVEVVVALMDSDRDGLMSLEDFVSIINGAWEEEKASDLEAAFRMYAMEGSSCITPKSLKRRLSRLGERRSVGKYTIVITHFDLNRYGVLNLDEFKAMMAY